MGLTLELLDKRLADGKITQEQHTQQCEAAIGAYTASVGPTKAESRGDALGKEGAVATLESADTTAKRDLITKVAAHIRSFADGHRSERQGARAHPKP